MKRVFAAVLLVLAGACAPQRLRDFKVGLLGPVGAGVEAAARAAAMEVRASAPDGAETAAAGVRVSTSAGKVDESMADHASLRLVVAQAAVRGRTGVFFSLPAAPAGRELTEYPEEWQALARVVRETDALRPILESGVEAGVPFAVPAGAQARAWRFQGRLYVLIVNESAVPVEIAEEVLAPWRTLFEARADARELLVDCEGGRCLPPERVVWLEGRF